MRNLALSGLFAGSLFSSGVLAESVTINTPLSGWHKQSGENAYYSQQVNYPASSVNTRSGQSIDAQIQGVISDLPKDNRQPGLLIGVPPSP